VSPLVTRIVFLWQRTETRLALFGASAVLAVYVGFLAVPFQIAEKLVRRGGYYVMFTAFALFLHALWRVWCERRSRPTEPLTVLQRWLAVAAIAALSLAAINAEPYYSKILNDEFVLQSTAFNMHFFREVATMVRGYDIQGVFLSTDNYLDKRPYFYPFLISLLHDLTGYRILNAFLVNTLLLPVALTLSFVFGRLLAGWRGGMLAVLLLGTLPLLGQNATGSGMELLNVVMILAALLLATGYLRNPDETQLAAFVLAIVLLAQSRYESALYALAAGVIVVIGWIRAGRVCLPWQGLMVPLLLVPCAWQNKVLSNSPVLWELKENTTSRFSAAYLMDNLRGAWSFLFTASPERANSCLLSAVGLFGLGWAVWLGARRLRRGWLAGRPEYLALACFAVVIAANTTLIFFYYWANLDDPMASRFGLPLHILLAFAAVLLAGTLHRRTHAMTLLLVLVGTVGVASAVGHFGHHYYSRLGIDEIEWERRYVNSLPPADRLVLSNRSSLPWLLQKTPSILLDRARLVADRLAYQLHAPTFREILVFQSLRPTTADGDHQIVPEEKLPSFFKLELLAEKRFGTKLTRISRLVAVDMPPDWQAPPMFVRKTKASTTTNK
jgi:hypothetical protein